MRWRWLLWAGVVLAILLAVVALWRTYQVVPTAPTANPPPAAAPE